MKKISVYFFMSVSLICLVFILLMLCPWFNISQKTVTGTESLSESQILESVGLNRDSVNLFAFNRIKAKSILKKNPYIEDVVIKKKLPGSILIAVKERKVRGYVPYLKNYLYIDDNGLVLPPHLAPIQVVIVPIYKNSEQLAEISKAVDPIVTKLQAGGISVKYDDAENRRPGFKFADYELKGVPVRLAIGPRDIQNNTVEVMRRDTLEKSEHHLDTIAEYIPELLEEIQSNIYRKALTFRDSMTRTVDTYEEFKEEIEKGGFILAHWDGTTETEEKIKEETKATIRCIPLDGDKTPGKCMVTGKPSAQRVIFARNY